MGHRSEATVREVLLENQIRMLQEKVYFLEQEQGRMPSKEPELNDEPYEITMPDPSVFQGRQMDMVAGIDGKMDYGKLRVYAWFKDPDNEEFRLGYFIDPLIKTNCFALAEELGHMHYRFIRSIANSMQTRFGDITVKYNNFYSERKQKVEFQTHD